jgi:hypothetical protein
MQTERHANPRGAWNKWVNLRPFTKRRDDRVRERSNESEIGIHTEKEGSMKNEVVAKQGNEIARATQNELVNEWGVPTTPSQDMIIPKILPMQGLSKLVTERKAMMGEFRDSITGKLLGSIDKPFEVIPFYLQKVWDIMEQQADGSFAWARTIPLVEDPMNPDYNDNLPWEGDDKDKDGKAVKVKRIRRMNFFVLIPDEVESGGAMPYVLSFKSTSLKEGKKLFSQMYVRNFKAGLPPAATLVKMGGTMQSNKKGTFVVPQVEFTRAATGEELKECLSWLKLVRKGAVKIDNTDEGDSQLDLGEMSDTKEF